MGEFDCIICKYSQSVIFKYAIQVAHYHLFIDEISTNSSFQTIQCKIKLKIHHIKYHYVKHITLF